MYLLTRRHNRDADQTIAPAAQQLSNDDARKLAGRILNIYAELQKGL